MKIMTNINSEQKFEQIVTQKNENYDTWKLVKIKVRASGNLVKL